LSILVTSEAFGGGVESHINSLSTCSFWRRCSFLLLKRADKSLVFSKGKDDSDHRLQKLTKIGIVNKLIYVYYLINEVKKNKDDFKIVHVHGTISFYAIAIISKYFKFSNSINIFVTLHGGVLHKLGIERYIHYHIIKYLQKSISKFICVSEYDKILHQKIGIDLKKCVVIENGINPTYFNETTSSKKNVLRKDKRIAIKVLSTLYPTKGVREFIMLLNETKCLDPSLHKVEIGGDGPCYRALKKLVNDSDYLTSLISFKGHINNAKNYIETADIMFFPSTAETFCLAIREALCLDTLCVCNDGGWIGESERKRVVLYENSSSESFRKAMKLAIEMDKEKHYYDGDDYRVLQRENYNKFLAKMENLYDVV
jgi:hypothetical protein